MSNRHEAIKAEAEAVKEHAESKGISHAEAMMEKAIVRDRERVVSTSGGKSAPSPWKFALGDHYPFRKILSMIISYLVERYATSTWNWFSDGIARADFEEVILFFTRVLRRYTLYNDFMQSFDADLIQMLKNRKQAGAPDLEYYLDAIFGSERGDIEDCMEGLESVKAFASDLKARKQRKEKELSNG